MLKTKTFTLRELAGKGVFTVNPYYRHLAGQHDQSTHGRGSSYVKESVIEEFDNDSNRKENLRGVAEIEGISVDELKSQGTDRVRAELEGSEIYIRVTEAGLNKVLGSGEYKPVTEGGTGGVSTARGSRKKQDYMEVRNREEKRLFTDRPVYGYSSKGVGGKEGFTNAENTKSYDALEQYGKVNIKLKSDIKERSTITFGDSLDNTVIRTSQVPTAYNNPNYRSLRWGLEEKVPGSSPSVYRYSNPAKSRRPLYIETQIHGGVKVSDISEVIFHRVQPSNAIQNKLRKNSIDWSVADLGD